MRNKTMFHKVKSVTSIVPYKLNVQFSDGTTKQYDVSSLFETMPVFSYLKDNPRKEINSNGKKMESGIKQTTQDTRGFQNT